MYRRGWVKRDHLSFGVQFWALEIFLLKCHLTLSPVSLETSLKDLWFGSRILVYVWGDTGHLIDYKFTTMAQLLRGNIKSGSFRRPSEQLLTMNFCVPCCQKPSVGITPVVCGNCTEKGLILDLWSQWPSSQGHQWCRMRAWNGNSMPYLEVSSWQPLLQGKTGHPQLRS